MPPRQPLKLKPKAKAPKAANNLAEVAAQLLAEAPAMAAPEVKKPRLPAGFSLYPDLTMAIAMLAKRQQAVARDGERAKLVSRWLAELQAMQTEMQKLQKLEQLANRLGTK